MKKISAHKIYKEHMENLEDKNKGAALRLSMEKLRESYSNISRNELYEKYRSLKRNNFLIYNVLPQILVGAIIGLATGLAVTVFQGGAAKAVFVVVAGVALLLIVPPIIFRVHKQILLEFQIKLIEEKIERDLHPAEPITDDDCTGEHS